MTLFFIVTAIFSALSVLYITKPLFKKENAIHIQNSDIDYFSKQLIELENAYNKSAIKQDEYTSMRTELSRALLSAERETVKSSTHNFGTFERRLLWSILGVFPIAVFALYIYSGTLGMPDFPIKNRTEEIAQANQIKQQKAMINGMVSRLQKRLDTTDKNNIDGWKRLAKSYGILKDYPKQAKAFAGWAKADNTNPVPLLLQARAIRSSAGDKPTADSFAIMERVLKIDQKNIEALFLSSMYLQFNPQASNNGYPINKRLEKLLQQFDKNSDSYKQIKQKIDSIFK